ncbi:MAG: hypothetical protein AAB382_08290, partial [Chloroflexota bacterium]
MTAGSTVTDISAPLPTGGFIEQADGTAWMGMYCLNMPAIALELPRYSDNWVTLDAVAKDISRRLTSIFLRDKDGQRPVFGSAQ